MVEPSHYCYCTALVPSTYGMHNIAFCAHELYSGSCIWVCVRECSQRLVLFLSFWLSGLSCILIADFNIGYAAPGTVLCRRSASGQGSSYDDHAWKCSTDKRRLSDRALQDDMMTILRERKKAGVKTRVVSHSCLDLVRRVYTLDSSSRGGRWDYMYSAILRAFVSYLFHHY